MLKKWQQMLEDLKRLQRMKCTLKQMKGELKQCYKLY